MNERQFYTATGGASLPSGASPNLTSPPPYTPKITEACLSPPKNRSSKSRLRLMMARNLLPEKHLPVKERLKTSFIDGSSGLHHSLSHRRSTRRGAHRRSRAVFSRKAP